MSVYVACMMSLSGEDIDREIEGIPGQSRHAAPFVEHLGYALK